MPQFTVYEKKMTHAKDKSLVQMLTVLHSLFNKTFVKWAVPRRTTNFLKCIWEIIIFDHIFKERIPSITN